MVHAAYVFEPPKLWDFGKGEFYEDWGIFSQQRYGPNDP
jgi:hypothetical protein